MIQKLLILLLVICSIISCKKDDDLVSTPIEPYIEFQTLDFKSRFPNSLDDTLKLKFYLRDGDSDLGLGFSYAINSSTESKYSFRNYYLKSNGKAFNFLEEPFSYEFQQKLVLKLPELITYKDRKIMGLDTLPLFSSPYNCVNWEIISINGNIIDTVYFKSNPNFYNIFVDLYVKTNDVWEYIDLSLVGNYPFCTINWLNSRFPVISNPYLNNQFLLFKPESFELIRDIFTFKMKSDKEGVMIYSMVGPGLRVLFSGKKIKLKVKIQDRALHKSNEIETSEVQL